MPLGDANAYHPNLVHTGIRTAIELLESNRDLVSDFLARFFSHVELNERL